MRDKAANIVLMLILNVMVIGTLVYKSRGEKVIDFSTSARHNYNPVSCGYGCRRCFVCNKTDTRQREIRAREQKRKKTTDVFTHTGLCG